MKRISRRKFLSLLTQGAGAAAVFQFLESCGLKPAAVVGSPTGTPFNPLPSGVEGGLSVAGAPGSTEAALPTDTHAPTSESATGTPSPTANFAYLAVARGGDDPVALTRAAVNAIGGIGQFVKQGTNVLIKPNICIPNRDYTHAATTNPWVVGTLVKMCIESGAEKVLVYDYPFGLPTMNAYADSGITDQVTAAGGVMEYVDFNKFILTDMPKGHSLKSAAFYSEVLHADVVIDVPIAKHHSTTGLTLGMKNLMGTVVDRGAIHDDIYRRIADLAAFLRPKLTVVDGIRILTDNGPQGGSLDDVQEMDTVIASADIVAADAYATKLFGSVSPKNLHYSFYMQLQADPNKLGYIKYGAEWGIGRSDLANLNIAEVNI